MEPVGQGQDLRALALEVCPLLQGPVLFKPQEDQPLAAGALKDIASRALDSIVRLRKTFHVFPLLLSLQR